MSGPDEGAAGIGCEITLYDPVALFFAIEHPGRLVRVDIINPEIIYPKEIP